MVSFTRDTFHNSQILLSNKVIRYATWSSHVIYGCAIASCLATFIPSHISQKLINVAIAPVLFAVSNRLDRLALYASGYGSIGEAQSHKGYAQWLDASLQPPRREVQVQAPVEAPAPVKFADVKQALSKPHCMLLGSTGDGKSTLAKHLAANCTAYTIVIDPHAAPDDWGNLPVFGAGRKYSEIAKIMGVTLELLQVRFDARDTGVKQFEPIIIICDEYPAIIASSEAGKVASSWMKLISREARKVSIRLVVLTQSPEVRAIGLEGEGSVRDNFCFIRLGEFALDHAKSLKDDNIKSAIENADRPAMLGNLPCVIPQLSDRLAMPVLSMPKDYLMLTSGNNQQLPIAPPSSAMATQSQSTAIAPVFQKIVNYLDGKDWKKDYEIKASIREFKDADTPLTELQGYLQFLETQNLLETRSTQRGSLEAKAKRDKTA
jgi:hypothetical protein